MRMRRSGLNSQLEENAAGSNEIERKNLPINHHNHLIEHTVVSYNATTITNKH